MAAPKFYKRGEPMPVKARGSQKLLLKYNRLSSAAFERAYNRVVRFEQARKRKVLA